MTSTTTPSLYEQAMEQIPGYREALSALATAQKWAAEPPKHSSRDLGAELWSAAVAGHPLPEGVVDAFAQRAREFAATQEVREAITRTVERARFQMAEAVVSGADVALAWLHNRLQDLMAVVRDLGAELGEINSAEAAIKAGAADTWTRLDQAVSDYDAIRRAQAEIVKAHFGGDWNTFGRRQLWSVGLLADALDHEQHWIEHRRTQARHTIDLAATDDYRRWLTSAPSTGWPSTLAARSHWPTTDHAGYLRWLATSARPWVPGITVMAEAYMAATAATNTVRDSGNIPVPAQLGAAEAARKQYADLTQAAA